MRRLIATTVLATCIASPAFATNWQVDPKTSSITFSAEQSGETFSGSFPTYTAHITLDTKKLETAAIHVAITIADAKVEGEDRQSELPGSEWLNAKLFPKAEFTSNNVTRNADGTFIAHGTLAIKDVKKEISVPFSLSETGNTATANGTFTINRADYHVGTGEWVKDDWVKFPVAVTFALKATKQP